MRRSMKVVVPTVVAAALLLGCQSGAGGETAQPTVGQAAASATAAVPSAASGAGSGAGSASAASRLALFFGDSNFVGGGCSPDPSQDMAQLAGTRLGYRTAIRGEGGTGFASGNAQYGLPNYLRQVRQGALQVSPDPSLVVIEGGSNDTGQPLGIVTRNAEKVLQLAQAAYPQALLVLMGPIDVRAGHGDVSPRVVGALEYAAGQEGVPFLDAYDWLPWRTRDGLVCSDYDHATPAGQRLVGRTLATSLRSLGA